MTVSALHQHPCCSDGLQPPRNCSVNSMVVLLRLGSGDGVPHSPTPSNQPNANATNCLHPSQQQTTRSEPVSPQPESRSIRAPVRSLLRNVSKLCPTPGTKYGRGIAAANKCFSGRERSAISEALPVPFESYVHAESPAKIAYHYKKTADVGTMNA